MIQIKINHLYRTFGQLLRGYRPNESNLFKNQRARFLEATKVVQFFYIGIFFFTINTFVFLWEGWSVLENLPQPIWPVLWLNYSPYLFSLNLLGFLSVVSTLLAAIYPSNRLLRILSFIGFFQIIAITNSFGKINHSFHVWVVTGFVLIFLPDHESRSVSKTQQYLTVIFGAQLITLSFYTSSGIWKIKGFIDQFRIGEIHAFHPQALSQQIAHRLLQTNSPSLAGPFFIEHPYLGWPLYSGAVLLELFSVLIAFRPCLHRFWGFSLLFFHFSIWLTMSIQFQTNMLFVAIFFILSPFHPKNLTVKDVLFSLPILGDTLNFFSNRRASIKATLPRR